MGEEFITIARVSKTQGRRGEVAAELHTDFPERFETRKQLFALAPDGSRRELSLEAFWPHKGQMVLKFAGIASISEAEALIGSELQIPATERAPLEEGSAYLSDLVGAILWDGEHEIGSIKDVRFGAGEAPLLVVSGKGTSPEYEIPFAWAYIKSVDLAGKEIRMSLPEGMLDVNAPLTSEEKQEQRSKSGRR